VPDPQPPRRHHRVRWTLVAIGVTVVALGAVGYWWKFVRRDVKPVDVRAVEREFGRRAEGESSAAGRPAPGVYRYATVGRESVDALTGQTNPYPAVTALTVTVTACGVDTRWDVATDRSELDHRCRRSDGRWTLRSVRTSHRFFNQTQVATVTCTGMVELPASPRTGWTHTGRCGDTQGWSENTVRVIGPARITVAGRPVDTLHVRITTVQHGERSGGGVEDRWVLPATGLIVRSRNHHRDTSPSLIGPVTYEETYAIRLTALTPHAA
jgi:hypothetical protein